MRRTCRVLLCRAFGLLAMTAIIVPVRWSTVRAEPSAQSDGGVTNTTAVDGGESKRALPPSTARGDAGAGEVVHLAAPASVPEPDLPPPGPAPEGVANEGLQAAQTPEPAAVTRVVDPPSSGETMIVTGSRIKRSAALAPSAPVEVIDRKAMQRTGATDAADLVQKLFTAAQGSGFQGGGYRGTVSVNLRGLGAGSTLILLNGRRLTPSAGGIDQTVSDLGGIPVTAIERIEILKGGGSAIYGADAVGGVVNVITRTAWNGLQLDVNGQDTTRMDQGNLTVSAAFGAKSERSRVSGAVNYLRREMLMVDKRPYRNAPAYTEPLGSPASYIVPDPQNSAGYHYAPDPACASVPGSAIAPVGPGSNRCSINTAGFSALVGSTERANGFVSAAFDATPHTTLFMELLASRVRQEGLFAPSNPLLSPLPTVPADHVDNPFGQPVTLYGRPLGAASPLRRAGSGDDTLRAVAGVRGDLGEVASGTMFEEWEWELAASWGISRQTILSQDTLKQPFQTALNSCSDPNDLSNCFNPFYSSVDGTGTPNSRAVIDRFTSMQTSLNDYSLQTYDTSVTGPLFQLPGGKLSFAVGGQYRYEWRESRLDHDSNQRNYEYLIGNSDANANRKVGSGYAELRWPFYRGVELQTAGRIEHYSDIDRTTTSPFAGISLAPGIMASGSEASRLWRSLQLTAQVTSAFRAPTLYQAYPGSSVSPQLVYDRGRPAYLPVQGSGNRNLTPEHALIISGGVAWQPLKELSLNIDAWNYSYYDKIALDSAQKAVITDTTQRDMGGPGDPRVLRSASGQIQQVQVGQINIPGRIVTTGIDGSAFVTLSKETFGGRGAADWGLLTLGAQGTITLRYRFPIEQAAPRTLPNGTTLPPGHCNQKSCDAAGGRNYYNRNLVPPLPRVRINFPINWTLRQHTVGGMLHWISKLQDDNAVDANGQLGNIPAWVTLDLQYAYMLANWLGKELGIRVGLYNVFNTLPAVTRDGYESSIYDPRGRMFYGNLNVTY